MNCLKLNSTKRLIVLFAFLCSSYSASAQIPIESYRKEITNLKSEEDIQLYWVDLLKTDQDTLLKLPTTNITVYDSLSVSNMIRTALMFEIHGQAAYTLNNFAPTMNQAHNYIAKASLPLWPIIYERLAIGNKGDVLTSRNLAYELESVSAPFYDYSLLNKEKMYSTLVEKLNQLPKDSITYRLNSIYENQKELRTLKTLEVIGTWFIQPFKNLKEEHCFEFVKLSDGFVYSKKGVYFKKLLLIDFTEHTRIYRIEDEPFGWYYELSDNNNLELYNSKKEVLISYSSCN